MNRQPDDFWNIRAHEAEEERKFRAAIKDCDEKIALLRRAEALRSATGFGDFLNSVEAMHRSARHSLETDPKLTDAGMREERGRARAFAEILSVLRSSDAAEHLAAQRQELQNRLDEALERRPIPRTKPEEQP